MTFESGLRVLLVEDDRLAALTGRRLLERLGCRVSEADTCCSAEAVWRATPFDLVVVDHRLPDGLGVDLIGRMRAAGCLDPVICLTAESEEITGEQRVALGIRDVVGKPIDLARFQASVRANAAPAAARDPAAGIARAGGTQRARIGRFDIITCPDRLTRPVVEQLCPENGAGAWLALDLTGTTHIDDDALAGLRTLALQVQRSGGRLCLAGAREGLASELSGKGLNRDMDMVADFDGLDALSRNPTSLCERAALMASATDEE